MSVKVIWKSCLDELGNRVGPQLFNTWFRPITLVGGNETSIELEVPNKFFLDWIQEHYLPLIKDVLGGVTNRRYSLNWKISGRKAKAYTEPQLTVKKPGLDNVVKEHGLNPKYTFENFVVGKGNEFARAACFAVANHLSSKYNPLFIYGGVGLGKTHLLQALGSRVIENHEYARTCYYTSERFMNEFIAFVSRDRMSEFRKKFRNVDLLLIDDIQFWAGKERTQEEFFHTFNTLYEAHKQIVVTSDRFPKEISGIEERLRSRFEWGLVADIQPPDTETKVAIIKKKSEIENIHLPDDVALFLASISTSNIRELEGYLIRIGAVSSLTGQEITINMAREALKHLVSDKTQKSPTIEDIQKAAASFFNIKVSDLKSKRRLKKIALPRHIAMYLAREYSKVSYPEIGASFGGKDHSTAIHAFKKIERDLKENPETKRFVHKIKGTLGIC
ncbi:MAG: chromosomal replication initiator protein DnaA [Thermodesulfobacteriota bacterium]